MNRFASYICAKITLVFALVIALGSSGFAHRLVVADIDESLLAYVAAGGSLDDLCGTLDAGGTPNQGCDACRLVDAAAVPNAVHNACGAVTNSAMLARTAVADVVAWCCVDPSRPVRAPPVV